MSKQSLKVFDTDEPNGIGNWMIEWEQQERIKRRIACPEGGYPLSEARFATIQEWENFTGLSYTKEVLENV